MHVVVLVKSVPETTGEEHFGSNRLLDRTFTEPVLNPNDEHGLEVALALVESTGGDVTTLTIGPLNSLAAIRRAFAVGANRAILVSDPGLEGSCVRSTARVLAAALNRIEFDLVLAGVDTSDGRTGVVGPAVATLLGIPYLPNAGSISLRGRLIEVCELRDDGYENLEATLPALVTVTQAVGELRYPTLRGVLMARSRSPEVWDLEKLGLSVGEVGMAAASTQVLAITNPGQRRETRVVEGDPVYVADEIFEYLSERSLLS